LEKYKDLPIIGLTADAIAGVKEKCIEAGMMDYTIKPIDQDEVFGKLVKWVKISDKNVSPEKTPEKQKVETPEIPKIEGIQTNLAVNKLGIRANSYINILKKFYNSNISFPEELNTVFNEGDTETAIRMLHTMKGVSGNIGAVGLQAISLKAESMLKENNKLDDATLIEFEKILNPILESLFKVLIEPDQQKIVKSKTKVNIKSIKPQLDEIKILLENDDGDAIEKIKLLNDQLGSTPEYIQLLNKAEMYDFEEALNILKKIKLRRTVSNI
jgi:two-component system, sensor histidine kinase and response regulator